MNRIKKWLRKWLGIAWLDASLEGINVRLMGGDRELARVKGQQVFYEQEYALLLKNYEELKEIYDGRTVMACDVDVRQGAHTVVVVASDLGANGLVKIFPIRFEHYVELKRFCDQLAEAYGVPENDVFMDIPGGKHTWWE